MPRRISHGFDSGRVAMLLAVLQRRARLRLTHKEVYVATVAGTRLTDPGTDLAVVLAIASAAGDQAFSEPVIALGEVGLAGELRRVPGLSAAWRKQPGWASGWPWCRPAPASTPPRACG